MINVIVVDDSALMRKIISDMIDNGVDMKVIDTARNGQDLLLKLQKSTPDIITLDVEMPVMDGITTLKQLKKNNINIPTIVLSSFSKQGTSLTVECLELGAFDFVQKPSGSISLDIEKVKDELLQKIKLASVNKTKKDKQVSKIDRQQATKRPSFDKEKNNSIDAVVIAASTGGPKALYSVITKLPEKLTVPVLVVQHMPVGFTKAFADRLNTNSKIKVVEASEGESILADTVYIAPGGYHMEVGSDKKIHLNLEPTIWGVRPAADKLFISASKVYKSHLLSVVLTGMGKDGSFGTVEVKNNGGITLSEDESTCTIYGMPKAAYETGKVDFVLPLYDIANEITKIVTDMGR